MTYLKSRTSFWPELLLLVLLQLKADEALALIRVLATPQPEKGSEPPPESDRAPRQAQILPASRRRSPAAHVNQVQRRPESLEAGPQAQRPATEGAHPRQRRATRISLAASSSDEQLPGAASRASAQPEAPDASATIPAESRSQVGLYRTTAPPPPPRPLSWTAAGSTDSGAVDEAKASTATALTTVPDSLTTAENPAPAQPNQVPMQTMAPMALRAAPVPFEALLEARTSNPADAQPDGMPTASDKVETGITPAAWRVLQLATAGPSWLKEATFLVVRPGGITRINAAGSDVDAVTSESSAIEARADHLEPTQDSLQQEALRASVADQAQGAALLLPAAASLSNDLMQLLAGTAGLVTTDGGAMAPPAPTGSWMLIRPGSPAGSDSDSPVHTGGIEIARPGAISMVADETWAGEYGLRRNDGTLSSILVIFRAGSGLANQAPGSDASEWSPAASVFNRLAGGRDSGMLRQDPSGQLVPLGSSSDLVLSGGENSAGGLASGIAAGSIAIGRGHLFLVVTAGIKASGRFILPGQGGGEQGFTDTILIDFGSGTTSDNTVDSEWISNLVALSEEMDRITSAAEAITPTSGPTDDSSSAGDLLSAAMVMGLMANGALGNGVFVAIHDEAAARDACSDLLMEIGCITVLAGIGVSGGSDLFV